MKTSTVLAKITALENASEFIRGHGEEGGICEGYFEDFTIDQYLHYAHQTADLLTKMADKLKVKYNIDQYETNINE